MSKLGELWDLSSLLGEVTEGEPLLVGDTTFDAAVQPDASLKLSRFVRSDNRTKAHQRAVDTVSNELQHRRSDLTAIDGQLKLLMARAMDGGDDAEDVGQEIAR
jgi:hypothetical protein